MDDDLVPLSGDWALHRDFAVRSAGFPVHGLDLFGAPDEAERLREVCTDPAFREALTWQNRGALRSSIDGLLKEGGKPSKRRQREEIAARYWQRYCSKNDTIGFFGPLAWGEVKDDGPALAQRSQALVRERSAHLEVWPLERFLQTVTDDPWLPLGPWPEEDARRRVEAIADSASRTRATSGLARLIGARDRIAAASREDLGDALDEFDRTYEEVVGEPPEPQPELAAGGRTPVYMDAMRDLEVDIGPGLIAELATSLSPLLESSRWLCGRSFEVGCGVVAEALGDGGRRPLAPLFGQVMGALRELPRMLSTEHDALQRRWAELLADPDSSTLPARARERFADHEPAWPISVFHSPDIQIAARDADAVEGGEFLAVVGDFHPGTSPLGQGVFALRHPDPDGFRAAWSREMGSPIVFIAPPRGGAVRMTARLYPAVTADADIHILPTPQTRIRHGARSVMLEDLIVDGETITDREGSFRAPAWSPFWMFMFQATVFNFEPFPKSDHMERITLGRMVLRRESWRVPVGDCPAEPAAMAEWARDRGMPRRLFVRMADEPKPAYLDADSPVLTRIFCRQIRRRLPDAADQLVNVSEMLPGPEECWLELNGNRYTSELRLAAVDLTRRGRGGVEAGMAVQ